MEAVVRVAMLLDFYGNLLTDRQREMMKLHYEDDLSLSEIAEQFHVSRAAVHDSLKRGLTVIEEYEEKLGLMSRFIEQSRKVKELQDILLRATALADDLKM